MTSYQTAHGTYTSGFGQSLCPSMLFFQCDTSPVGLINSPITLHEADLPPSSPLPPYASSDTLCAPKRACCLKWPAGMYIINMDHGLKQIKSPELIKKFGMKAALFEHIFDAPFKISTFNDQKLRWKRANPALCKAAKKVGHTPLGLWSVITEAVSLHC